MTLADIGQIVTIALCTLPIAGIPLAALLYLDYRKQCRADDEIRKAYERHHLRVLS